MITMQDKLRILIDKSRRLELADSASIKNKWFERGKQEAFNAVIADLDGKLNG